VIVAAKLNCNVQLLIVVVPVLVMVMLDWNPLFHDETSEYDTVVRSSEGPGLSRWRCLRSRRSRLHGRRSRRVRG